LFNRDELRTRKPASAPRLDSRNGIAFIAPRDGDYGGSWIAVNQFGLTLCLLNRFDDSSGPILRDYTSRGLLIRELIDCPRPTAVNERLEAESMNQYRPFTLVSLFPRQAAMLIEWTGQETRIESNAERLMPIASSSLLAGNVVLERKQQFQKIAIDRGSIDAGLLFQYHRNHLPERGPASVCMHRADARTVSLSAVTVTKKMVEFAYHPNSPCQPATTGQLQLERTLFTS
jgi:hypothetical protein